MGERLSKHSLRWFPLQFRRCEGSSSACAVCLKWPCRMRGASFCLYVLASQQVIHPLSNSGLFFSSSLHLFVRDHNGVHGWRDAVPLVHRPAFFSLHRLPRHHPAPLHSQRNWHPEIHQVPRTCLTPLADIQHLLHLTLLFWNSACWGRWLRRTCVWQW